MATGTYLTHLYPEINSLVAGFPDTGVEFLFTFNKRPYCDGEALLSSCTPYFRIQKYPRPRPDEQPLGYPEEDNVL
ncbi:unnamed protein product [Angiostrongylus costaricensis]|uniref:DNA methyltransferase n=1 Tax=Angiostrongylus costaricensis TaxID=334426 RepID=A0A0R3PW90_ANGCS|nr:unnamed protein product [Angiostrongylus costaricensis]